MIKLKKILEEGIGTPITREKAIDIIKKNDFIYDAFINKNKWKIYRGVEDEADIFIINPKQYERTSKNTNNYYTLIIDNSSAWNGYPKRSNSLICSVDDEVASSYGNVYIVVPLQKNAKIGFCPHIDIWMSFEEIHLQELNTYISAILKVMFDNFPNFFNVDDIDRYIDFESFLSYSDLLDLFNSLDDIKEYAYAIQNKESELDPDELEKLRDAGEDEGHIYDYIENELPYMIDNYMKDLMQYENDQYKYDGGVVSFFQDWFDNKNISFLNFIKKILDPQENNFSVHQYYSDSVSNSVQHSDYEIWSDSKSLMIHEDIFDEIIKEINNV